MVTATLEEMKTIHQPVMLKEVLEFLNLCPGMRVLDATVGGGGHAKEILQRITPDGILIGIDQDSEILEIAREELREFPGVHLIHENFRHVTKVVQQLGIDSIGGCLLDLGISSYQLERPERGFSFQLDGGLDMRMDPTATLTAFDLVNHLSEWEIAALLYRFGNERYSRRIARFIVKERQRGPIRTTRQLANIVEQAIPHYRWSRIHPATRTFQALRIEVNHELEILEEALPQMLQLLSPGGRICVISFHSLEDRIIKTIFRQWTTEGQVWLVRQKPLTPTIQEITQNPRARSAKLRVAQKC